LSAIFLAPAITTNRRAPN